MRRPFWIWMLAGLLCLTGAWLLWHHPAKTRREASASSPAAAPARATIPSRPASPGILTPVYTNIANVSAANTNPLAYRLSNTTLSLDQLARDRHAILLENALIDTDSALDFTLPAHLRAPGDAGAYIVQARGPINQAFRAVLAAAGAQIISYIPNNAYLVRVNQGGAGALAASPLTQAVLSYEPYYKIQLPLLRLALQNKKLPPGTLLTLGLFSDTAPETIRQIESAGGTALTPETTPIGTIVNVIPPRDWLTVATLPGTKNVELCHPAVQANDLNRVTLAVAADTQTPTNYLALTGSNVVVEVNDSGIDATHPDFSNNGAFLRIFGDSALSFVDTNGHGTHVAGIIGGDGYESTNVINAQGSIMPAMNGQFRGMAPLAWLYSVAAIDNTFSFLRVSDRYMQETPAKVNALISNNSWNYGSDAAYDLHAASFDAAVRDALPTQTGSQPVLFVFSAGNDGNGGSDGSRGDADTILSPGTAKNVVTVGAIEELRYITNMVTDRSSNASAIWQDETDTGVQVASFSSRGNVGINIEGTYGRYKPDVVAPGTFVISTRSAQWDEVAYYSPTNHSYHLFTNQIVGTNGMHSYNISVPANAVGVQIAVLPNIRSPIPFPTNLMIYVRRDDWPTNIADSDFVTARNGVSIPPDSGGNIVDITSIQDKGFYYAVVNTNNFSINYNLLTLVITTNDQGNYFEVLSNLNNSLGGDPDSLKPPHYYRYESGTSMAAANVSGVLALIQDYFTNTLHVTPSPALLKALLINGARPDGKYSFQVQNDINFQGWGLANLTNSLPPGMETNVNATAGESMLILDQSPTNGLATGDSHTYLVTITPTNDAVYYPLRVTLTWTDPPGDPAAALKLVNNLDLVVTNLDGSTNPPIYYGNNIGSGSTENSPADPATNAPTDVINNVENVFLSPMLGTNYSITVIGRSVNVNAVTAHTNNVVQDYALVISCGEGEVINAFTVTDNGIVSAPTTDQLITIVTSTNKPLLNQIAGASTPLLGTNTLALGTNTIWGTNGNLTIGMTNQWHFYVVTNTGAGADFTNAAFITFLPYTLSLPRMGVYADATGDATRPEADIDLYVATEPGLTNLDPVVISNCLFGVGNDRASLGRGGTEFAAYTNSVSIGANSGDPSVYYVGVYAEDQMASEYAFIPIFTHIPFSQPGPNGSQIVNGLNVPVDIPDGSPARPGTAYVFALFLSQMEAKRVVVTDVIEHENFGDLIGTLSHGNRSGQSQAVVLNNHEALYDPSGIYANIYDDSGRGDIPGARASDGPRSLNSFIGQEAIGPWILTMVDDSLTQTGRVTGFNLLIEPHQDLGKGITVTLAPGGWFIDYVAVPAGYMTLTVSATNITTTPSYGPLPIAFYERYGAEPTATVFDQQTDLTNCLTGVFPTGTLPGNSLSTGPPLPAGFYFIGLFNSNATPQDVFIIADLVPAPVIGTYNTNGPIGLIIDDAVTSRTLFISSTQKIASVDVSLVVTNARISDLAFTLLSPTGQRVLLMENRGNTTATDLGHINITTNFFGTQTAGGYQADTNILGPVGTAGTLLINYDFYTVPDSLDVYYDGVNIIHTGLINGAGQISTNYGPGGSTNIMIVINQGNNTNNMGTAWQYTPSVVNLDYTYVTFTENTNLTDMPIKFAIPPYDLPNEATNFSLSDFEMNTAGDYFAVTNILDGYGGWTLPTNVVTLATIFTNGSFQTVTNVVVLTSNEVSVVTDPATARAGTNYLSLAYGVMQRTIPVTPGKKTTLTYSYRGPGIAGWWRGEGNATDSSDPEHYGNNGLLVGRFNFPAGEVGQAFQMEAVGDPYEFPGTNNYVQVRQPPVVVPGGPEGTNWVQVSSLDVGTGSGFTIEGWINPTNVEFAQPLVEWLARVPTNGADTNLTIEAGPFLDRFTGHYYYLLGSTNWTASETWATQLGGHLVTVDTANEQNWVYDTFARYGGLNRNLWIGLTNNGALPPTFSWSSGLTNVVYTNWAPGQPFNCSGQDYYTAILGPTNAYPGLWVLENNTGTNNNGVLCFVAPTNGIYGVVEVDEIQTNGVQLWISVTNSPGMTNLLVGSNGCLYANLVDITNGWHEIYSPPGLIQSNVYQHIALTYNTNTGVAMLFYNGTNVASTNLGVFVPKTTGDLLLGKDISRLTNNYYGGKMDEMSIYRRVLSDAEITAIYNISAFSTNRNLGKFDPSITPALSLAEARITLDTVGTNIAMGRNTNWLVQGFTFTPHTNSLSLQVAGLEPGLLLDNFGISEVSSGNLYYFPETSLDVLNGDSAYGTWTLEIWDTRTGLPATDPGLVNWHLQITVETNVPITLENNSRSTNTIPPGGITYYAIEVPVWATSANNILVSATRQVDMLFNQARPPATGPGDITFLLNSTGGSRMMTTAPLPPPQLLPGQTYYLGVRNNNAQSATVVVEVDFNMTALTNGIPFSDVLTNDFTGLERYYIFDVSTNAVAATFQLLKLSSNADLVVRKGTPLPTLTSSDYGSFNTTNVDENIYVLTNSSPVPLSAGRWYLGVFRRDPGPVYFSILAKELDPPLPTIIDLTNNVPFTFTTGPGAALTNFFRFTVSNTVTSSVTNLVGAIHFELYGLNGDGDLTVETNAPPLAPPFFRSSQQPGLSPELIYIRTNAAQTNLNNTALTNLAGDWYLGVPNHEITNITCTILAVIDTNLAFPAFPGAQSAQGAGAGALGGRGGDVYHVVNLNDSGPGSLREGIISFIGTGATNAPGTGTTNISGSVSNFFGARTIIFEVSGTINLLSPLVITNSYLTIVGQTAPGAGITVAGQMTTLQSAHDVVIRNLRFRRGTADDSLMLTNVVNVIADHVSASWSSDNLISVLASTNVTVQWSILADSLFTNYDAKLPPQGVGSLLRYGYGEVSFHHNLYANNYTANPGLGDNLSLDFVNNVIYNWGIRSGYSGTNDPLADPDGLTNRLNYVCNYLIAGPDTAFYSTNATQTNIAFYGGTTNTWIFQTNNFIDSDTNGLLNGADTAWGMFTNYFTAFDRRFPLPPVFVDEAFLAYEKVLDFAGPAMGKRDVVDTNIVTRVRTQSGTLIAAPALAGMVAWWKGESNLVDSVGTNNGTVTQGTVGYAPAKVGLGFSFNGAANRLVVPDSPSLNFGPNRDFSIEGWIKLTPPLVEPQQVITFVDKRLAPNSSHCQGYEFGLYADKLNLRMSDNIANNGNSWSGGPNLADGTLHHIALTVVRNSTTGGHMYVDGVQVLQFDPTSVPGDLTTTQPLRIGNHPDPSYTAFFKGLIDEVSLYKRALTANEIAAIYKAGSAGKQSLLPSLSSSLPYLDTDRDGIPDFWEVTFGQNVTNASNNQLSTNANYIGYTDLEEYNNWLAIPHALTVTNTLTGVDLYVMSGNSGHLSFSVTNAVNGTVYLTNVWGSVTNTGTFSNSFAIFTPAPNYSGYAAFDYYVTNNDTIAYFGPVTVSVVVSAVPVVYATNLLNSPPVLATNLPNRTIDESTTLTVTNTATDTNAGVMLTYTVTMVIDTNAMIANGWPLTYATTFPAPVIDANGIITWTPGEAQGPGLYIITTVVTDNGIPQLSATNSFTVTVNEVNTPPFWPPNVPSQTNYDIGALTTLVVTNTATDSDIPPNPLTYQLIGPLGAVIDTNGIITWTPTPAQAPGVYIFTTIVTDTNAFALANQSLSATNVFTVTVSVVAAPFVFTQPAQSVTGTGAQLNGMVTPNGSPTTAWFEWGTTMLYGNQTPPVSVGSSFNVVYKTNQVSGLAMNVPYHFRLVASNAMAVVYGFDQVLDEANVVVWGADYVGQARVPAGLSNVVAIAGAYDHSLALKNNRTAVAWGDNTFGQGTVPGGLNNLVAVAGGAYYSMALKNNGTVASWGANILGQTNVPAGLNNVVTIAGGTYSSLALRSDGTVVAWGAAFFGLTNVPAGLNNAVAIAGGGYHNLAIRNAGTVVAWGDNSAGQTNVPAGLTNVVAIAGGSYHSLALRYDGTVVAWGDNSAGQTNVPAGLTNVVAVAAGGFHSLALRDDGTIMAWGDNTAGQTSVPVGLSNVVATASGYLHSMALIPLSIASSTNLVILNITNGVAQTNSILAGSITYYQVTVPTNADFATNSLLFALNGPLNVWFDNNYPPTTNLLLLPDATYPGGTNGSVVLSASSTPLLVPGSVYYLGVQNTNSFTVTYALEVDFHLVSGTNGPIIITSITATNIGGTNGYLLRWEGPTNFQYEIQWTASFTPVVWNTILNPVINVSVTPTNGHYSFFDDGSLTGGLGPMRFYRVLGSLNLGLLTPSLPTLSTQTVAELTLLTVTNTATNGIPPLIYSVSGPAGVAISSGGIITWTPNETQGPGTYTITTIVTSSGLPPLSATNSFVVVVTEVNRAPYFLSTPAYQTIGALSTLTVTNAAGDPDIPVNPLTYTLLNPPAGMTIDTNGVITWTPTPAQALTTNLITAVVTDFNVNALFNQNLSATNTFTVRVPGIMSPFAFTQPATSVTGTSARLNGMATPNGPPTTAWFEWGTSATYGNQTPPVNVGGSYSVVYVTSPITNLVMNLPYHFRLVVSNAMEVVYGFDQIFDEADVAAWGANYIGQTNVPAGLSNVVAVAGAYDHSLALKNNGTAVGWGDDTFGQATVPAGLSNLVAVAGGAYYSMALNNGGTVTSWGADILGQTNVPAGLNSVVNIAGGRWSSLALRSNGRVVAWGYNVAGLTNVPASLSNAVAIAGGGYHNLAIKNDGTVVVWGDNGASQTNVPAGLTNVVAIAGGSYHSLALKYDGTVVAWGDNSAGQTNVPAGLTNVVAVAAGGYHSLALKNDGNVLAWGDNSTNQASIPSGLSNVVAISSGYFHNLALASPFNVNFTNTPPFWLTNTPPPVTLDELTTVLVTNTAGDADLPPQTLTYSLLNPLAGAGINPTSGVITLSPLEADGPATVTITAVVTDNGSPPLSVTNSFTVTVNEVNLPPVLPSQPNYIIDMLTPLVVNNTAMDSDIPTNPLTYQLSGPPGALISTNGVITWTPTLAQGGTTNVFTTVVTDTNPPAVNATSLSATNSFTVIVTTSINLTGGQPQTNTLAAGGVVYYAVAVPANADFATNILLFATPGPVNVWFDTNSPPTTNLLLLPDVTYPTGTNGSVVLSTNTTPPLVPGATYYLGVQNINGFPVTFAIEVDFHLMPAPIVPIIISSITATNIGGTNGYLLQWQGPTNLQYEIQWTASLLPVVVWNTILNPVINVSVTPTNGHFSFFDDGSLTGGLGPMRFYRVLGGLNLGPVTGSDPVTNTVLAGALSQAVVTVPAGALWASNLLLSATGPLNVWFNPTNPPVGNTNAGDFLMLSAATSGTFVLNSSSVPPLGPGTNYYLGFQNPSATDVTFAYQVVFGFASTGAVSGFSINPTNGGFLLTWYAPTNELFQVRWTASLAPTVWNTFSNLIAYTGPVTPTNGRFTFFDDGLQTGGFGPVRFYQLILLGVATNAPSPTNGVIITGASVTTNGLFQLQWNAATNDYFQVEWTTNLLPPIVWFTNAGNITSATTNFTFVDTNALTTMKFYRLIKYP